MQVNLSAGQIEAFYHDEFVTSQMRNFTALVTDRDVKSDIVVDIGGGVGHFAAALAKSPDVETVRVVDMDPVSVKHCEDRGLVAIRGDALTPPITGDEDVVCFNLILHHLVGTSERATLAMQSQALASWKGRARAVFVDEYIYDSYWNDISGKLIYAITSSRMLSALGSAVSKFVPSLRANTFGIGVRFRSTDEWLLTFTTLGFRVDASIRGSEENVSFARRLLLIKSCRRDSFLLVAA